MRERQRHPGTLVGVLALRSAEQARQAAYVFLENGEEEGERLTYGELERRARDLGAHLQQAGLAGRRALLLYPPGLEFVVALWGCLYAGVAAVPASPPRSARTLPRLRAIARDARPAAALTTAAIQAQVAAAGDRFPEAGELCWISTDTRSEDLSAAWREPDLDGDSLAFLQYTSGSTAAPKGVMVSHANLLHNEEMIHRAFRHSERSVVAGWLPLHHDMGLIGNVFQPLYAGATCVLMSPAAFRKRPRRWLEAITRYRATTSGGPNFAYDLCVQRIAPADRAGLDLSSWEVAFNGAEPVRAVTLERFAAAFAPCGFRRSAFYPCYGLAEATLFAAGGEAAVLRVRAADLERHRAVPVAAGPAQESADGGRALVGCGGAWLEQRLAIADPESGAALSEGQVGEIWLAGPSVARGYWGRPEESARTFGARLAGDPAAGPWLRTGDLGFVAGGVLYVTGRRQDLLLLRGRNHYPQDIELTVESCHPALRPGCGAAFAVEIGGEERLVVAHELDRRADRSPAGLQAVADAVRAAVAEQHEAQVREVVLLVHGTIPKTSSGKIQRHACREGYLQGTLKVLARCGIAGQGPEDPARSGGTLEQPSAVADGGSHDPVGETPDAVRETAGSLDRHPPPSRSDRDAQMPPGRGRLLALPAPERAAALGRHLAEHLARVLGLSAGQLDPARPLTAYGLDSLAAVELQGGLADELGVEVPLAALLEGETLQGLAVHLLAGLTGGAAAAAAEEAAPAAEGPAEGDFPLSAGQQALWFLERLAPASAANHIAAAARLHGALDPDLLAVAFRALPRRHPALRTTFDAPGGTPRQRVAARLDPEVVIEDAAGWEESELGARLAALAFRPFDLAAGPLLRVGIFRRGPHEHLLLLAVHHLVADFASLAALVADLGRLAAGGALPAPPGVRFTDWARGQAAQLAGERGARLAALWQERLAGLPDLALPTDRPRPPVQTFRGGSAAGWLDAEESARIAARAGDGTLFALLLAAFQGLLARLSGQDDFAVGSPASLRRSEALREVVGYLVNPVVLRADLAGDPSFSELLERARRRAVEALEGRDLPFPWLAERLRPVRDPGRPPLFQAMLSFERAARPADRPLAAFALGEAGARAEVGPWRLESLALPGRPAGFDLTLVAAELDGRLGFSLQFNADLFDGATAERTLAGFLALLAAAAADAARRLADLPLLSAAEQAQLAAWNATRAEIPAVTLHELVAAQARLTPEAPAVEHEGRVMSYGELDGRAAQLAGRLVRRGVGPGSLVGLLIERSAEMVAALLAILRTGAAYVPLDPAFPAERLAWMVEDASRAQQGPLLVVTQDALRGAVPPGAAGESLLLLDGEEAAEPAPPGTAGAAGAVGAMDLAYVLYTSGSTGRPKGVAVPHGAVVNFLRSMAARPGLTAADTLLAVTTLSFDIAGLEIYLPLSVGARVAVASRTTAADGRLLAAALERTGATCLQATPATWRLLLAAGWRGRPGLKMLCGGEALPRELAERLLPLGAELWNVYGPTETTIWSAVHSVAPGEGPVAIGGPIANTAVHVVGRRGEPVPIGVPGELWIGGAGVARGYLNRPDLTAERFVPDPFVTEPGTRAYRTGDLGRRRPDGLLECLGRVDHQVKVRGHRIELQEIEARLARHPAVAQAVAVARGEGEERRLVGYVVPRFDGQGGAAPGELRAFLAATLPHYMVPTSWVFLDALPLTPNGKVDRQALPAPAAAQPAAAAAPAGETERAVAAVWQEVLGLPAVGLDDSFFDLGGHSLLLARVQAQLLERLGADLTLVDLFRFPTVRSLAAHLSGGAATTLPVAAAVARPALAATMDVAVIGLAGRFPGAADAGRFWQNLRAGVESIATFSDEELLAAGVDRATLADPAYVRAGGVLDDVEGFDAPFFGFSPREAEVMDPQHRIFLECAWEALENAGYGAEAGRGRAGVFAGVGLNTYLLQAPDELARAAGRYQAFIANDKDFVPTRVSYKLNLKGPSVDVQTACSSSLVAVHLACRSLLAGECDLALAGGVSVRAPHRVGYRWEQGGIPSPDGRCRAYAADAQGTVFGNGAGIVVLKRLADARAAGDTVLAVIRGSAINNDGAGKIGYTAPSVDGQAEVIATALAAAGVDPATVGYVEGHGTGTELGDPIEVAALAQALGGGPRERPCALGSVKTNIGHLDTAAGVAGLIKAVLAVRHGEIPPSLHAAEPNPKIGWEATPLRVATELRTWPGREEGGAPRRAGVSSFGIGGTNAHVVIEEAPPEPAPAPPRHASQLLVLSARTPEALEAATARLAAHLEKMGGDSGGPDGEDVAPGAGLAGFADVAFTLQVGRKAFAHRRMVVAGSAREAAAALAAVDPERVQDGLHREDAPDRPVAFLFSGQGSQYPGMAADLYRTEPVYRAELDRCAEILRPLLGLDLRASIDPEGGDREEAGRRLARTEIAQPALFAVEWALARLWLSRGVRPRALLGHSLGEYVAACLAGVFSLEDALAVVAERGRLMGALPGGAMLAVPLPEAEVLRLLREHGPGLSLAAVNAPELCAVSGPEVEVAALAGHLDGWGAGRGLDARRLHTSHAFHSTMMEPARAPFAARLRRVELRPPQLPFVSNLTGTWITAAEATDPAYWAEHLLRPVRFAAGLRTLLEDDTALLLEVGPGNALANLARRQAGPGGRVLASVRHPQEPTEDGAFFQHTLGRLWLAGVPVDFAAGWEGEGRRRVALPAYPFEHRRYWITSGSRKAEPAAVTSRAAVRDDLADWFYAPLWKQTVPAAAPEADPGRWLLLPDAAGLAGPLAAELGRAGAQVEVAAAEVEPAALAGVHGIVDLRGVGPREDLECELERGFSGQLRLAQAVGRRPGSGPLRLAVVTSDLHRVAGVGGGVAERAIALGLLRVIPQEMPGVEARAVDVALAEGLADGWAEVAAGLARELLAPAREAGSPLDLVALRDGERWVQGMEPVRLAAGASPWRERGTYLITGGFGGLGLLVAEHLARAVRARLVLVGRRAGDVVRLRVLEEMGAEVLALQADVADEAALREAVAAARTRFGALHGAIHAAGVPGGGVILGRPLEAAAAVLAPKVRGTLALASALAGEELDFLLLCSSLNGLIGGFGQADYCAANAYLDAFAAEAGRRSGTRVVAVAWDRLRGVGMAARSSAEAGGHPLLGRRAAATPERAVYRAVWSPADQWVLGEHRVLGTPTAPGTAYLEMARAALADIESSREHGRRGGHGSPGLAVELKEVFFLEPLALADGESREVLTVLDRSGPAPEDGAAERSPFWSFKVLSRQAGAEEWQEHARGLVAALAAPGTAERAADPGAHLTRHRTTATGGADDFIAVGPRWRSLGELRAGGDEALATLELAVDLQPDLAWAGLHPALLDLATGAARLVRGGAYLPLAYERLRLFTPLPARFRSHLRFRDSAAGETGETLACDVSLSSDTGEVLAQISGFAMKRVGDEAAAGLRRSAAAQPSPSPDLEKDRDQPSAPPPADLGDLLLAGIPPAAALEALDRILAGPRLPRVAVSGEDLETVRRRAAALDVDALAGRLLDDLAKLDGPRTAHARPEMANAYTAPANDLQRTISEVWQRVLGLDRVGIHDNFFELGGTSLTGVQVIAELKTALQTEIPAVSLFEAPTVAALARFLQPPQPDAAPAFSQARDRAEKKKQALAQPPRRPPARQGVR